MQEDEDTVSDLDDRVADSGEIMRARLNWERVKLPWWGSSSLKDRSDKFLDPILSVTRGCDNFDNLKIV